MTDFLRSAAREYFDRRHLLAIIGTLLVSLHTVDELVRGEELAPPYIPLLVLTAIYPLLLSPPAGDRPGVGSGLIRWNLLHRPDLRAPDAVAGQGFRR